MVNTVKIVFCLILCKGFYSLCFDFKTVNLDFQHSFREKRLAKKYYDKLFKEYCISDLSRYKENKVTI